MTTFASNNAGNMSQIENIPEAAPTPAQSPVQSHAESPAQLHAESHAQAPAQSPAQAHVQSPAESSAQSRVEDTPYNVGMTPAQMQAYWVEHGIAPVIICGLDDAAHTLTGVDGRVYHEIETNYWACEPRETNTIAYLHSNLHHGGIVLRPMFIKVCGTWLNAATGAPAPAGLPYCATGSHFQSREI